MLKRINFCQQRGATVSFSNAETKQQLTSFAEEKVEEVRSVGTPFQQAGFQTAPLQEKNSLFNSNQQQENSFSSSSMVNNNQQNSFSSSQQQQISSSTSVQKSQQMTSQSSSSSSKSFSSMQSSNMAQKVRGVTFGPNTLIRI